MGRGLVSVWLPPLSIGVWGSGSTPECSHVPSIPQLPLLSSPYTWAQFVASRRCVTCCSSVPPCPPLSRISPLNPYWACPNWDRSVGVEERWVLLPHFLNVTFTDNASSIHSTPRRRPSSPRAAGRLVSKAILTLPQLSCHQLSVDAGVEFVPGKKARYSYSFYPVSVVFHG